MQPPFAVSPCARLGVVCSLVISNNHRQSGGRVRILPATTASTSAPPQRRKSDQNKLGRVGKSRSGAMGAECEFTMASDLGRTRWPSVFTEKIQRRIPSRGSWPCSRVLMERRQYGITVPSSGSSSPGKMQLVGFGYRSTPVHDGPQATNHILSGSRPVP